MASAISFSSAVALLGRFPALAGVDFEVAAGEVVLAEGANGAGKTTLLRAIAGLVPVVSGQAVVLGHDLRVDRRSARREIGLLAHNPSLYDELTVAENALFFVRASGGDPAAVEPTLARLGLAKLAGAPAGRLSTGQRRRVALAIVAARNPAVWLVDEPYVGLDAEGREVLDELIAGAAASGAAVVLASHEAERARAIAGRRVLMAGGRTVTEERRVA